MMGFNSKKYWDERYRNGGNSGIGSQGNIAKYKALMVNNFIKENNIQTVCELGCGDIQFTLYNIPDFTGYDISEYIIEKNKTKYNHKFTCSLNDLKIYDLTMSLDVIYHLLEDKVYKKHIEDLFRLSKKYVLIYSPDRDEFFSESHNRYRKFSNDIPQNFKLKTLINNPYKGNITQSDFYIFERI
jgi:hypothetical protein